MMGYDNFFLIALIFRNGTAIHPASREAVTSTSATHENCSAGDNHLGYAKCWYSKSDKSITAG